MNLIQLFYSSLPAVPFGSRELIDILEPSRSNNKRDAITGMLAFSGTAFLQALEGDQDMVNRTFTRISGDKRHRDVQLIGMLHPAERQFPAWTMGFAGFKSFRRELVEKYSASGELHGGSLLPDSARALLIELASKEARPDPAPSPGSN